MSDEQLGGMEGRINDGVMDSSRLGAAATEQLVQLHYEHRWRRYLRMFLLRHVAFRLAREASSAVEAEGGDGSYGLFTYWREDNHFLEPLELRSLAHLLNGGGVAPAVVVDEHCGFGSYSDKIYIANVAGAALLFDPTEAAFVRKMAQWVEFAHSRRHVRSPLARRSALRSRSISCRAA